MSRRSLTGWELIKEYNKAMTCKQCGKIIIQHLTGMEKTDNGLLCNDCSKINELLNV